MATHDFEPDAREIRDLRDRLLHLTDKFTAMQNKALDGDGRADDLNNIVAVTGLLTRAAKKLTAYSLEMYGA